MRATRDGHRYDTDTASDLAVANQGYAQRYGNDLDSWEETLCQTPEGLYFIWGQGGAKSRYGRHPREGAWTGGAKIIPLSREEALAWDQHASSVEDSDLYNYKSYREI